MKLSGFLFFFLLFFLFASQGCFYYIMDQARGQIKILLHRKPISQLQTSSDFPLLKKQKLALVEEVRRFARDELKMPSPSYSYFVGMEGKAVAYNVSASFPLDFHPLRWTFPFVGTVPYLGFFEKGDAVALKYRLLKEGYDVVLQEVAGYSTLGWFEDPLFAKMLENEGYLLAELVLHEITHSHIYHSQDSKFNENVATFVGEKGTQLFLARKYGKASFPYQEYQKVLTDREIFQKMIRRVYQRLDHLYKSPRSREEKKEKKKEILEEEKKKILKARAGFRSKSYRNLYLLQWNNAMILSLKRYRGKQKYLEQAYQQRGKNLALFVEDLKKQASQENPWEGLCLD